MNSFSEKSKIALGYYVYGLADPRTGKLFYIGKGIGDRVFSHEIEHDKDPDSEKKKIETIDAIQRDGKEVIRVILNFGLDEQQAFAAEAALINAFNYFEHSKLTNIVAGHHSKEALSVEDFEHENGAELIDPKEIKEKILIIKINNLYERGMEGKELYDSVRGLWKASKNRVETNVEYVFGVYHSLIVAVYRPSRWLVYGENMYRWTREEEILKESKTDCSLKMTDIVLMTIKKSETSIFGNR